LAGWLPRRRGSADTQGVRIDLTFAGDYELAVPDGSDLSELVAYQYPPGAVVDLATIAVTEQTISYSVAGMAPTEPVPMEPQDPVRVEVRPAVAGSWLGVFDARLPSPRGVNCVVALPDHESLAVISHGAAYRVWADDPRRWEELSIGGVMQPVVVTVPELVLLVEHTTILAYGPHGLAWESEALVWDDLEAVSVDGEHLRAKGFDAPRNKIVAFTVDLRTGRSRDAPRSD
jgi:hypothetical protein